ncbi:MAG: sugar ABC transporter permease [Actinobacteria bacterium]|nr:sugar ABC transporter permease [Actinomycetota bacterium]
MFKGVRKWAYIFIVPFFIGYFVFQLFPNLYSFYISLMEWSGIGEMKFIGLKNYITLFTTDPYFIKSLLNTAAIIVTSIPLTIILGLIVAVMLFDEKFRGRRFFQLSNFLPYIVTPVAVGLIFNYMFDWKAGIINKLLINLGILKDGIDWLGGDLFFTRFILVLLLVWQNFGYFMIMYLAGLSSISPEIYEAAKVDGSSKINTFFKITLPLLKPVTLFVVIISIIGGMQLFDQPYLLMMGTARGLAGTAGGPNRTLLTVMWNFYDTAFGPRMNYGLGAAITYTLFIFIVGFSYVGIRIFKGRDKEL